MGHFHIVLVVTTLEADQFELEAQIFNTLVHYSFNFL